MGVNSLVDVAIFNAVFRTGLKMAFFTKKLSGQITVVVEHPPVLLLDPDGSPRDVLLPAEADSKGLLFYIFNTAGGQPEILSIKEDSDTIVILALDQNEVGLVHCDGTTWRGFSGFSADITATIAELNILDGVTALAAELNYLDLASLGTGEASKAVVLDAGEDFIWPSGGFLTYGCSPINATGNEINNAADVSGRVQELTVTAAVVAGIQSVELNHIDTVIAATISDAVNHQGLFVVKDTSATGTELHTLTLTAGTFNGSDNVATFNARDEALIVYFDSTGRGQVIANVGSVALS